MSNTHPIRQARKAAGLTSTEVARRVGVSHAAVLRWEYGDMYPTPKNAQRLMRVLPALRLEQIYNTNPEAA